MPKIMRSWNVKYIIDITSILVEWGQHHLVIRLFYTCILSCKIFFVNFFCYSVIYVTQIYKMQLAKIFLNKLLDT